jgi:2-(1,2-epoxy-1,2-dihydrophenyl)acetyl-CoA isomerase
VHRGLTVDLEHQLADEAMALELSSRSEDFKNRAKNMRERNDPGFQGR